MKIKTHNSVAIFNSEKISHSENNDCAVRATAIALNQTYTETHAQYKAEGRKNNRGVKSHTVIDVCKKAYIGLSYATCYFLSKADWNRRACPTISQVAKIPYFTVGTHIIFVKGHVFTLKNGEIYGNRNDNGRAKVVGFITTETGVWDAKEGEEKFR
jgi:hypothetical protein